MNFSFKKICLIIALTFVMTGLVVTSVLAADTKLPPGCNPEIHKIQGNHSGSMRTQNKGFTHQYIKKNDPSLGTTCFDQGMGLTSRLGYMFSDRVPVSPPPPDSSVFPNIAYPDWAATNLLAADLNYVITPTLNNVLGNFGGTVTAPLGTTSGNFLSAFVGSLSGILGDILTGQGSILDTLLSIVDTIGLIDGIISALALTDPFGISAIVGTLNGLLSGLTGLFTGAGDLLGGALSGPLGSLQTTVMGPATSMDCDRMGTWWSGNNAAPDDFYPIEASGIEMGIPYMPMADLFGGMGGGALDGMATGFLSQIGSSTGSSALNAAYGDLTGPLSAPGMLDSWQSPPLFPPGTDTLSIINGM